MNNYDLHERAQELADTHSAYELARRVIEAEERLASILPEPDWEMIRFGQILGPDFHPSGYRRSSNGRLCFQWFHTETPGAKRTDKAMIRLAIGKLVETLDSMNDHHGPSTTACDDQFAADPNGGDHFT